MNTKNLVLFIFFSLAVHIFIIAFVIHDVSYEKRQVDKVVHVAIESPEDYEVLPAEMGRTRESPRTKG